MNSNMVKPEKFGHLHLIYHFTVYIFKDKGFSGVLLAQPQQKLYHEPVLGAHSTLGTHL